MAAPHGSAHCGRMPGDRFDFEMLWVFQRALELLAEVDAFVIRFCGHRRGLGWQMFDAATSSLLNIAESRGRTSGRDRAHFLDIANGSAHEVGAVVCAAEKLGIGPEAAREEIRRLALEVIAMLTTLGQRTRLGGRPSNA